MAGVSGYNKREDDILPLLLFKYFFAPLSYLKANKHKVLTYEQRTFDKHTVTRQKLQQFLLAHCGDLILKSQRFIKQSTGIK